MMIPGVNPSTDRSVNGFIERLAAQARVTNQNVKNSIKENLKSFWFEATRNAVDVPIAEQCGSFNEKAFAFIDDMVKSGRCTRKESTRIKDKIATYMDTLAKTDKEITTMAKRNTKSGESNEVVDTPQSTEAFDNALDTEQQPGVVAIPNETVAAIAAATKAKAEEEAAKNAEEDAAKPEPEQVQQNEPGRPELNTDAGESVPKVKAVIHKKAAKEPEGQQQVNINISQQQIPTNPQPEPEPQVTSMPEITEEVQASAESQQVPPYVNPDEGWSQPQMTGNGFQQPWGNPNGQQCQQPQMQQTPQGNPQIPADCTNCTSFDAANQAIQHMYQMQAAMQYQRMLYAQQQNAMAQQAQQMVIVVKKNKRLSKRCKDLKRKNDRIKFGLITGGIAAGIFGAICLKKNYDENGTIWPQF